MAQTPEGKVKDQIKKILKARGAWYFMPVGGGYGPPGIPDFIVCLRGRFIGLEAKSVKTSHGLTPAQRIVLGKIAHAGGMSLVVDEENLALLDAALELQDFYLLAEDITERYLTAKDEKDG